MARKPRSIQGGMVYHVMNRASARARCFHTDGDYAAFERVLQEAVQRFSMRLLTYAIMPNHFHLVLWPRKGHEEALSHFMQWLQQTHTQRWHVHYHNAGTGRLYQGRFKAFAVQSDGWGGAVRRVCRYVERNPVRAKLCRRAESWRWSGLWRRAKGSPEERALLCDWPEGSGMALGRWLAFVNRAEGGEELASLRDCVRRGRPLGDAGWLEEVVRRLGLEHTVRRPGRPRKGNKNDS